ncbi:CAP domain-containing protein [Asticcacaulis sp. BYS171W]|uniref:CAP domain-containing protein n=1 Tax=Asticcacaulis aquaticus TaxID=2984212 RepID=A0ABT5HQ86_9CAUL|nr:CAP domain-containing protein [Asticcacaulis aquaticus]MDC7681980.1 CAP domain-containing protein [Asticcacaulis aquaticus]
MKKRVSALAIMSALIAGQAAAQDPAYASKAAALYRVAPDIGGCKAGELTAAEKQKALDTVNDIRRLHALPPVVYDPAGDEEVMQISLMTAANGQLSHLPPQSWRCYSEAGVKGAQSGNLHGGLISPYLGFDTTEDIVIGWVTEARNAVPDSVGHRRWLLDPFLKKIAFGRVSGPTAGGMTDGSAIKVIYPSNGATMAKVEFVAYPQGDYPARYFDPKALLSFAAIIDTSSSWNNQAVDYSAAKVTITRRGGGAIGLGKIAYDTYGFGMPNNLQVQTPVLQYGVYYDVSITNVKVRGVARDYSYWFRIVQ